MAFLSSKWLIIGTLSKINAGRLVRKREGQRRWLKAFQSRKKVRDLPSLPEPLSAILKSKDTRWMLFDQ
jgi:hypothetical protein